MIADSIGNVHLYRGLGSRIGAALALIARGDCRGREPGKVEVEGASLFYLVQAYATRPREQGRWESHRKYIDVQYIVDGTERFGWAPLSALTITRPYDPATDAALYAGNGDFLTARPGSFLVLWPDDAHMPGIAVEGPSQVQKVVVKVLL